MKFLRAALPVAAVAAAYSAFEPYRLQLIERRLEIGAGRPPLTILHLSDTHMTGRSRWLARWLQSLPVALDVLPDVVLATGDFIDNDHGIELALEALAGLEARYGRFYVLGSHDYFVSRFQGYGKYLGLKRPPIRARPAQVELLESGLQDKGWISLSNTSAVLDTPRGRLRIAGVDDPYLARHSTSHIARLPDEALALGLVHAPDVVSEWALRGFDVVVAGHTHGGQVRIPGLGGLVTNCSLPNALSRGPHRIGAMWLHVSPGLGQGRFAPLRFCCRPEATLLRLTPAA
jgi:predicted MPP superfamily phosphohydrolase